MALINCPECKNQVSDSAKTCPHCGFELIKDKPSTPPVRTQGKKTIKMGRVLFVLFLVIVIMTVIGSLQNGRNASSDPSSSAPKRPSSGSSTNSSNKFLAYYCAEDFVERKLKSPSTAKFPKTMERSKHITDLGGGKFKINSWVDSQNSFGATIRTNFTCTVIIKGETAHCEELVFQE